MYALKTSLGVFLIAALLAKVSYSQIDLNGADKWDPINNRSQALAKILFRKLLDLPDKLGLSELKNPSLSEVISVAMFKNNTKYFVELKVSGYSGEIDPCDMNCEHIPLPTWDDDACEGCWDLSDYVRKLSECRDAMSQSPGIEISDRLKRDETFKKVYYRCEIIAECTANHTLSIATDKSSCKKEA